MKKLFALLTISFVLLGCQQTAAPESTEEMEGTEKEIKAEEVVKAETPAPAFEVSVTSVKDGATVKTAPVAISGKVSKTATSVAVNGYQLQGYEPESEVWAYNAKPEFGNLKVGENTYTIVAKDAKGASATTILKINYQPEEVEE